MESNYLVCLTNSSNLTSSQNVSTLDYSLESFSKVVTGGLLFILVLPFVLFKFNFFPIGTTSAVLIGAFSMVLGQVINQDEVYNIMGRRQNLQTIALLIGMMILFQYLEREKLVDILLHFILKAQISFENYLCRVSIMSFILAALFTNDACCVVITPLIIKYWTNQKRPLNELEPLILAIPTSANIGSVLTIFGNPQMALIAAYTSSPLYQASRFDLRRCVMSLGIPAVMGYILNIFLLIAYFHIKMYGVKTCLKTSKDHIKPMSYTQTSSNNIVLNTNQVNLVEDLVERNQNEELNTIGLNNISKEYCNTNKIIQHEVDEDFKPSPYRLFKWFLCLIILLVIILYFISTEHLKFDLGLVPLGGGILVILVDTIVNRRSPSTIIRKIDWGVILMFFGIFVWMAALNSTRLPRYVWKQFGLVDVSYSDPSALTKLTLFILVGSNIFSNVPLTLIVLEQIPPCLNLFHVVVYLAWVATIAGNLTLFGSVANLIVSEKCWETIRFKLSFWTYLKYGFLSTIIICTLGVVIISLLFKVIQF